MKDETDYIHPMFKPVEKKVAIKDFKNGKKLRPAKMIMSTKLTGKRSTTTPDTDSTSISTS